MKGRFQFVLHAHLPFVRHPENAYHLEENWLFEAMSETYLPLLEMLDRLERDDVPGRITISLSTPLVAMLDDELLRERFDAYLTRLIRLGTDELERCAGDPTFAPLARWYHERFVAQQQDWNARWNRDLVSAFAAFQQRGRLDLITCAGTHGFLPLMRHEASRNAQIRTGIDAFSERIGVAPAGLWLPECAFERGIDRLLADARIQYTIVDSHAFEAASSRPARGLFAPIVGLDGTAFFARDPESSRQVWSSEGGYPGDPNYRDFYRDIGFDLPLEQIGPYVHPDGIRIHTGYKYWRVTERHSDHKEPWNPDEAARRARRHARHFVDAREQQLAWAAAQLDVEPVVTCPYDAELFGHWWFEGPLFLEHVIREAARRNAVTLTTPRDYLLDHPQHQVSLPAASSWGHKGHYEVWAHEQNVWIYRHLHIAEDTVREVVRRHRGGDALHDRALRQICRELLLAQASDWAFIIHNGTSVDYAVHRTIEHLEALHALVRQLEEGDALLLERALEAREAVCPIYPDIDPDLWIGVEPLRRPSPASQPSA